MSIISDVKPVVKRHPRVIAIGRCVKAGAFKVVAPADWPTDEEIDAMVAAPSFRLTDAQVREMEEERIGEFETYSPWR
jgi:hypothetical protein